MHTCQICDKDKKSYFSDSTSSSSRVPAIMQNNDRLDKLQTLNFSKSEPNTCFNNNKTMEISYSSQLVILEQPTEKFRFRYKSEMHGTHGSLNGDRSEKSKKTFPEVELRNFNSAGVIRCSLYQTNINKPSLHSHQLVVHKDDMDVCDPHDVYVSPEKGYIARFENMGIIHTAKKEISIELLKKKKEKLKFELQCNELSHKQEKTLRDEAEREVKTMNLNQVRLCFEAFKLVDGGHWIKICEPVFSRPINNRKSALTGELKICRLSIIAGTVAGGDDLILLVEKVNKNNVKVRFFEIVDDSEVWEAFANFTEADVHHQYAIVVRTPPYKNKDIDSHVNVFIELVRENDNERSSPVTFRYKPRDIILSRKRRRTSNSSSFTTSPLNSYELPESVVAKGMPKQIQILKNVPQTKEEFNNEVELKALYVTDPNEYKCDFNTYIQQVNNDSDELEKIMLDPVFGMFEHFGLETDGETSVNMGQKRNLPKRYSTNTGQHIKTQPYHTTLKHLISAFNNSAKLGLEPVMKKVKLIFEDFVNANDNGDTIVHEIIRQSSQSDATIVFKILYKLNLTNLLSQANNLRQTPLHIACLFDQAAFIGPLLGLKCDPNMQDTNGNTALHIAIAENLKQCMDKFVAHMSSSDFNVNLTNDDGRTPLDLAIRKNNSAFVKVLLMKYNASVKIANSRDGNNALHLAVQQQNREIVKIVLENSNVNINATNRAGHTAIDLANALSESARTDILKLLQAFLPPSNGSLIQAANLIKKEPELDDSNSSTGDDDDKSSQSSIEIKQEDDLHVKHLLKDKKVYRRLSQMLNVDEKWRKLGNLLKVDHLLFMWSDAEAMLRCIVEVDGINGLHLLNALKVVDKEAASMVTSLLNPT